MRGRFSLLAVGVMLAAQIARGDCGSIPFKPWVSVFEPNQRAVIAYDGKQEILLLSTDLRASEPSKVLEVIPFPAEPEVKEGHVEVFSSATALINSKLFPRKGGALGAGGGIGGMGGFGPGAALPPAGEVTFHERIGAHDISVTHALARDRFVTWVDDYLRKSGVDNPSIPAPLESVVEEYLRDGFKWFAFDVVELGEKTVTKDAIQYRFETRFLYYPLKITRVEKGDTTVDLLILSPRLVAMPRARSVRVRLVHQPLKVTKQELRGIDEDLYKFLRTQSQVLLRTWEIKGRLSEFRQDLIAK
jgi:hypothetical protein